MSSIPKVTPIFSSLKTLGSSSLLFTHQSHLLFVSFDFSFKMENFLLGDCLSVWSHIQHEEEQLKMKRRWLMGLPSISKSEQMRLKTPMFLKNVFLPESLLREDDVSYEIIIKTVDRSFGTCSEERRHYIVQDYLHLCDRNKLLPNVSSLLPSVLDDMNNTGLLCLANIATGSSVKFEKTRWRMKKVIKEYLPKILRDPNHKDYEQLLTNLPLILKDPHSFQETRVKLLNSSFVSHHAAAAKLLEELKDMPSQTLSAMRRKLKDAEGNAPQLQTPAKSGWTRHRLVKHVKRCCTNMLSKVNEGDELQKPLAKAMAIAVLSLKLRMESQNISLPEFFHFSPEIEALHNEIIKAIWFLKEMNIRNLEVEELRLLLDPKAEIPNAHFRAAIRRMLMEYLFECSEMAVIPNQLQQTLAIINRRSLNVATKRFSKEEIEEEVESVSCVSSQLKQIVLDFLPDCDTDKDFADVYMEDMQETDDDDQQLETNCSQIGDSIFNDEVECIGESMPVEHCLSTSTTNTNGLSLPSISDINLNSSSFVGSEPPQITDSHSGKPHDCYSSSPCQEPSIPYVPQNTISNQYLAIQEICDETSLVAHRLIGRLLEEFLRVEGVDLEESKSSYLRGGYPSPEDCEVAKGTQVSEDALGPVLVKVVKEVLPSFSNSGIERVKKLMELS